MRCSISSTVASVWWFDVTAATPHSYGARRERQRIDELHAGLVAGRGVGLFLFGGVLQLDIIRQLGRRPVYLRPGSMSSHGASSG